MDKCANCNGTGLVEPPEWDDIVVCMSNCPDCHGLGRNGE